MEKLERQVLKLIPIGQQCPKPAKEIAHAVKVTDRTIMDIIARLIIKYRVPIVGNRGDSYGYYIPANETERIDGLQALQNQTTEQVKRLNIVTYCSLTEWKKLLESEG